MDFRSCFADILPKSKGLSEVMDDIKNSGSASIRKKSVGVERKQKAKEWGRQGTEVVN